MLNFLLWKLLVHSSLGAQYCFDDYLPMLFGTESADTRISVATQHDVSVNQLLVYVGGSTYDVALTENSAPTSKRAWAARV